MRYMSLRQFSELRDVIEPIMVTRNGQPAFLATPVVDPDDVRLQPATPAILREVASILPRLTEHHAPPIVESSRPAQEPGVLDTSSAPERTRATRHGARRGGGPSVGAALAAGPTAPTGNPLGSQGERDKVLRRLVPHG